MNATRLPGLDVRAQPVPARAIDGIAAVLMPFLPDGRTDLEGLARQIDDVVAAGLCPAVNMDTGYVQVLTRAQRSEVLGIARKHARPDRQGRRFIAGAFVDPGQGPLEDRYRRAMDEIEEQGGTPIVFPCPELRALAEPEVVRLHARITERRRAVLLFELGEMFVPYGRIYDLDTFGELLSLPNVVGLKHSSLDRRLEWARLHLRDSRRPDFRIYTGNDLAIDMVTYGSDYLLGLAAFHPAAFAAWGRAFTEGDVRFFDLGDLLQYLGAFSFRAPLPAYRHDAAIFLELRGMIGSAAPPPGAPTRPDADRAVLAEILARIEGRLRP